jgi:uncharacterized protein
MRGTEGGFGNSVNAADIVNYKGGKAIATVNYGDMPAFLFILFDKVIGSYIMIDIDKNNLGVSSSPYLRQHADNPVNWQEWTKEVLDYAKEHNKPLLVSVGYATCHWCHVMAQEAFSDDQIASYLNSHFINIKVDREQRPDIDKYLMSYIQATGGHGGWPLNAFLTPEQKPFFAATYLPVEAKFNLPPLLTILQKLIKHFDEHGKDIPDYYPQAIQHQASSEKEIVTNLKQHLAHAKGAQFPAHSSLLFLLSYYETDPDPELKKLLGSWLDNMAQKGLHDHLQGGFYRYCVDASWTIPHFEKMLYDQAMHLWVYSLAYKVLKTESYKTIAEKIVFCLEESFEAEGLYYSAHDADTNHQEGITYLWTDKELAVLLSKEELAGFAEIYELQENFEGAIHLLKKQNSFLPEIENKLLQVRKKRQQPFVDKKLLTNWNALTGIALLQAGRWMGEEKLILKAQTLFELLLARHYDQGKLFHSSNEGVLQKDEFLEDIAAVLLLATYLQEETGSYRKQMIKLRENLKGFYQDGWKSNRSPDFITIPADSFDHPSPSSVSMAEAALLRTSLLLEEDYPSSEYHQAFMNDFHNLMAFVSQGNWHIIHSPVTLDWQKLPANSLIIRSSHFQDCWQGTCREFSSKKELMQFFIS